MTDDSNTRADSRFFARPNPFRDHTVIRLEGAGPEDEGEIRIADAVGREIRILRGTYSEPAGSSTAEEARGFLEAIWDGLDGGGHPVPAGLYIARTAGGGAIKIVRSR